MGQQPSIAWVLRWGEKPYVAMIPDFFLVLWHIAYEVISMIYTSPLTVAQHPGAFETGDVRLP